MFIKKISFMLLIALSALLFIQCDEKNPVNNDDESEHAEAAGLIITSSMDTVYIYKEGVVTGSLQIKVGLASPMLTVNFYDEESKLFQPDTDHHSLGYEVTNTSVAQMITLTGSEWQFALKGIGAGSAAFRIKILHEGHDDFVSELLPVTVIP